MSYSFSVTAASKAEAKEKIGQKFDSIVLSQPTHRADRVPAEAAANAFVDVLADPPEGYQVVVSCYGSLSWRAEGVFYLANVNVDAGIVAKAN